MSRIIAVVSAKGGVGKSSICTGLGKALCERGLSVLLVDTDISLRSLDVLLNAGETAVFDWGDILQKNCTASKAFLPITDKLFLLRAPASGNNINSEDFVDLIKRISKSFDFVILDSPAGLEKGFNLCVSAASEALVVSTPDEVSIRAASVAADRVRKSGISQQRLIINRYSKKLSLRSVDEVIDGTSVRLIGIIPEDRELLLSANGHSLTSFSSAALAFKRIAGRVLGESIPLKLKGLNL
ncbi:MAG: Septum site-determining protein MinD [Firmicutes bacterium ADurb.Bin300]|jgi:septum site-determining protein MinD|nr:MAG: Septum site-determining protein MinD [Firmicutes bacterium ADurb.Bin300]